MSKAVRKESVGKASATGGKERKVRSRAACGSCKSTKQRCDGPNIAMERCRRCELYSLECVFPASSGPLYCVPQKFVRSKRIPGVALFTPLRRPRALPTAVAGPSTTLPRINTLEDTLPPNSGRSADGNSQQSDQLTQKSVSHPLLASSCAPEYAVRLGMLICWRKTVRNRNSTPIDRRSSPSSFLRLTHRPLATSKPLSSLSRRRRLRNGVGSPSTTLSDPAPKSSTDGRRDFRSYNEWRCEYASDR